MKKLFLATLLTGGVILMTACNKYETQNQSPWSEEEAPALCILPTAEGGIEMLPAMLTPEMLAAAETKVDATYTIPIVFHIFGETQGGTAVNAERIHSALEWINNDFHGVVNPGDPHNVNTINTSRKAYLGTLDIKFALARYDENGNRIRKGDVINGGTALDDFSIMLYPTTHAVAKSGPGNYNTGTAISKIAWNNRMYMNVYIIEDLYANGATNNSGVAWYPNDGMTSSNTARVVYNGRYLPPGRYLVDADFCSVISHEFGHFMNLGHTFGYGGDNNNCGAYGADGGSTYGDLVADTPECQMPNKSTGLYWGYDYKNCRNEIVDHGNFMNYGVYCNFTQGQVTRMKAALSLASRSSLWTASNVEGTVGEDDTPPDPPVVPPAEEPESLEDRTIYVDKNTQLEKYNNTYNK